jgi:hypothetical protein
LRLNSFGIISKRFNSFIIWIDAIYSMKKFSKQDQRLLAIWAADTAKRVLPFFEKAYPNDDRPRKAIAACRRWISTGVFKMADIRKASLDAHAAARKAIRNDAACFAARAAGQAVATAHVPEHAFGPAYYALKIVATNSKNNKGELIKELKCQIKHLPKHLRKGFAEWRSQRLPKNLKAAL